MSPKRKSKVVAPRNPKLVKGNGTGKIEKQSPSAYLTEMQLSTDELLKETNKMRIPDIVELLDMSETTHQKATSVDIEEPLFQPYPSDITFQNFEAHQTYKISLQLRNKDQVARLVKVIQEESPYFKVISPPDVGHKVAPGMETIFIIQFTPDQKKDYTHEVIVITEREKYVVPVKAIGGRGILDFPDEVHFGVCPVKYTSGKTLLVRNVGNESASFHLHTERPFIVHPVKSSLEVGKSMQVEVEFCAEQTGSCSSYLVIQYETGEDIFVSLHGDAIDINVRLDKNNIKLDTTYIGNSSRRSVSIFNRSDVLVKFSWKRFATLMEEEQQKRLYLKDEGNRSQVKRDEFLEECISDPMMRDEYALFTRSFKSATINLIDDRMLYHSEQIVLDPLEGEIWPNSSMEMSIVFKPDKEASLLHTAYLDITGRETRLPLKLRGDGIGPKVRFSFDTLDVENIFVNSRHSYEVVLKNVGDIDAVFSYTPSQTLFGQQFTFTPANGILKVGEYQAIQILFESPHLGKFIETFHWAIDESSKVVSFNVRGNVIGPTFHFDTKQLKFHTISFGFTYQKTVKIINTSLIAMSFHLHIPTDGSSELASDIVTSFLRGDSLEDKLTDPIEFEITPASGMIPPSCEAEVEVKLTALRCARYETVLVIDVDGVGENILSLPISAKSVVPNIELEVDALRFSRCFVGHRYEKNIVLVNDTEFAAKYQLVSQAHGEESGIFFETQYPQGVIEANSTIDVPVQIMVTTVQPVECVAQFYIFGSMEKSLTFLITAIGEGPVVHANMICVQFNSIPVLVDSSRTVMLSNESLIPAHFHCEILRKNSHFTVEPKSSVISPEASVMLKVTANVNDNLRFQDKLQITVVDGQVLTLNLSAQGSGTTIVTEPPLGPTLDLGPLLSSRTFEKTIRFVNKGRRAQQIYWSTEGFTASSRAQRRKTSYNPDDMKFKNVLPPAEPSRPVFQLIPDRLSLFPGQHQDVLFKAFSEQSQVVKEKMICQSIIGNSTGKEKIIVVDVHANFIQPLLHFSERNLNFSIITKVDANDELGKELKRMTMTNISLLPLHCTLKLRYPFSIVRDGFSVMQTDVFMEVSQCKELLVQFDPNFENSKGIRRTESKLKVTYRDHPSTDEVSISGDVFYPNLRFDTTSVHFDAVLNDTEHVHTVKVTNVSPIDVSYTWNFVRHDICFEGKDVDEGIGKELSDSSDEEKQQQQQPEYNKLNVSPQQSRSCQDRPNTSPYISELGTTKRPMSAPAGLSIFPPKVHKQAAVTWNEIKAPTLDVGIEEVFDVLPLYGCLKPTESQQFQFTFYGHSRIMAEATAVCHVKGGPDYEVQLKGEASVMEYKFSEKSIDFGKQLYDEVNVAEIELINVGKVSFDFLALDVDSSETEINPCVVNVFPQQGYVAGGDRVRLTIRYIAGIPQKYETGFQIRVGHFEPETLSITGEAVFPRIVFDLPRYIDLQECEMLYERALKSLLQEKDEETPIEDEIFEEMDRLKVEEHSIVMLDNKSTFPLQKKQKHKIFLTEFILDFGHVVLNSIVCHTCQLKNTGDSPVTLMMDQKALNATGFYVEVERVKGLPILESVAFDVVFNPTSSNATIGFLESRLPVKIAHGPTVCIILKAYVSMPELTLSTDIVCFNEVKCGECKVITVQLSNTTQVVCEWQNAYLAEQDKQIEKRIPMHLRRKMMKKEAVRVRTFEMMPPSGSLQPGQKINVQIKFMPTEETSYQERLFLKIAESTQNVSIMCKGHGLEPQLEFENSLLQFGPILPHTGTDDVTFKVINPCSFPVEFYSLEFDKQYLEEEKVLRSVNGYDEQNTILLPPRAPGAFLPKQIIDHYELSNKLPTVYSTTLAFVNSNESAKKVSSHVESNKGLSSHVDINVNVEAKEELAVGDLEITPVSAAIASYLGIDLSMEGKAARNRRGLCIIVHGAPLSGKTATSIDLATKYKAALISIDEVVEEAIKHGRSSAAQRTRELCSVAARLARARAEITPQTINELKPEEQQNQQLTTLRPQQSQLQGTRKLSVQPRGRLPSLQVTAGGGHQTNTAPTEATPRHSTGESLMTRKLEITSSWYEGEDGRDQEYYTCVLPDDVLVELLSDRMQLSDCHQGVIIDGLYSMFTSSMLSAATILLRAINNRKFIYALTLKFDFETWKDVITKREVDEENRKELEEKAELIRMQEMSEEEYDSLTVEERAIIDQKRLDAKRVRLRRKRAKKEEEDRERRERELEEKRLEDEKGTKKGRKSTVPGGASGKVKEKKSVDKLASVRESNEKNAILRPDTGPTSEQIAGSTDEIEKKQRGGGVSGIGSSVVGGGGGGGVGGGGRNMRQKSGMLKERQITPIIEGCEEEEREEEKSLREKFLPFQQTLRDIYMIFDTWDRTTGNIIDPDTLKEMEVEIPIVTPSVTAAKKADRKKIDKEKLKEITESPVPSVASTAEHVDNENEKRKDGIGIMNFVLDSKEPQESLFKEIMQANILPCMDEVMDGIGVGPSGPPIPPEATFSVIPYPVERESPRLPECGQRYMLMSFGDNGVNGFRDDKSKSDVSEVEKPAVIEKKELRRHRKHDPNSSAKHDPTSSAKHKGRHSSMAATSNYGSPPIHTVSPEKDSVFDGIAQSRSSMELVKHRWVIPANESIELRISFMSDHLGQFDQTLNFELVGTRRRYQLFCRGICSFPSISREPRIVFPNRKKYKKPDEILHKKFILNNETFEFGPLLAGKNRERYREGRYPENMEKICIMNSSPMHADVAFSYLNDANATAFFLEPTVMSLKPGDSQMLTMWAYPKTPGHYEDTLVCCVKENPEPICFKICADGVRPELELDRKSVPFDRVLLHRKETRTVYLRNSTLLPVAWRLSGLENLGDDFSVTVDHGIIEPLHEFSLQLHFRAIRPVNIKKIVRLEVSDADNVIGLLHSENITVQAEAYDVALDMSFPKGADGGLDFGVIRVGDETKQTCTLKNKGKYEISYNFYFERVENSPFKLHQIFNVSPNKGTLIQNDRPTQVQVTFKTRDEITIKDLPILKCQIIEPSMGDHGEIIASIPIRINARSAYSKYSIFPTHDINFGPVLVNIKKTRTLVVENKGDFDFRYTISKVAVFVPQIQGRLKTNMNPMVRSSSRQGSLVSGRSQQIQPQRSRRESVKGENAGAGVASNVVTGTTNIRLTLGAFMIFPASGIVLPGSSATISVDMMSDIPMVTEEEFIIDISERSPMDHSTGIEYRLYGEACLPSIVSLPHGIASVFEEQRVVKNLNVFRYHSHNLLPGSGVYGEDENKFIFCNVIVGHKAKCRFQISNPNKVPCDIVNSVKPLSNKQMHKITDIYEVEPLRTTIPSHSSIFATVTFQPNSMQSYSCIFETLVEGLPPAMAKGRSVTFEIVGDGNLPRITVVKPTTTNKKGYPIMLFNRLLIGRCQIMPVVLTNDGTLPCEMEMKLIDPNQSFVIRRKRDAVEQDNDGGKEDDAVDDVIYTTTSKPVFRLFKVPVGCTVNFLVEFTPRSSLKMAAELRVSLLDNPFEENVIQLIGEGYEECVTIDNIHCPASACCVNNENIEFDGDEIIVPSSNQLNFGDCMVNVPSILNLTLTNHSAEETLRYRWNEISQLSFSPSRGHLPPKCARDIKITYHSTEPHAFKRELVQCTVESIILTQAKRKAAHCWDNTKRVVQWVDDFVQSPNNLDVVEETGSSSRQSSKIKVATVATKKKVVQIEAEPSYTVLSTSSKIALDLVVSSNCNYAKFVTSTDRVYFKDTFMFQTRLYSFTLKNEGEVKLNYSWNVQPGKYTPPEQVIDEEVSATQQQQRDSKSSKSARNKNATSVAKQQPVLKAKTKPRSPSITNDLPIDQTGGDRISVAAHSADGRPASAIVLAYDASGYGDSRSIEDLPFTIEPRQGCVPAGEEATFTVRFSPLEIDTFDAILLCFMDNLAANYERPIIALQGTGVLPWCHFELEETDYIKERRNPELRGPSGTAAGVPLDVNTKVIEFQCCGLLTVIRRSFFIVNPTNTPYTFHWTQESTNGATSTLSTNFTCKTTRGTISPGKKSEIIFEYEIETIELAETFWRFTIDNQNVSVPFLLVAHGNEPRISMDRSYINFKELLVGHVAHETINILNDEKKSFQFSIEESSRHAAGHVASLLIEPMKGVLAPNSSFPISISYKAELESELNFNIVCRVKQRASPLTVNVKAQGFKLKMKVLCEDSTGQNIELSQTGTNIIHFGNVELNDKAVRQIYISNTGNFGIGFTWTLNGLSKLKDNKEGGCGWSEKNPPITMTPLTGNIASCHKRKCQLTFCPPCKLALKNCDLLLKVVNGPTYRVTVVGFGVAPAVSFSFTKHDFGACFLYRAGLTIQKKVLTITNTDSKDVSLELLYTNTSHLEVLSAPKVLSAQESHNVEFRFYPREAKSYSENVAFELNGLSVSNILIRGQGTEMKVDVVNVADRIVNLGALQINEKIKRVVQITNNSLANIDFHLSMTPFVTSLLNSNVLSIAPQNISLKPKACYDVIVQFHPRVRIPKFTEEVILECLGVSQPLFAIVGACQGMEIKLDSDAIPFGSVTMGSSSSRKLTMVNSGDMGLSFSWNVEKFRPAFSIVPHKGYISAGMTVAFQITFLPPEVNQDIRYDDLQCTLEKRSPLKLVLTGSCIPPMPSKEVLHFNTNVRNRDTKTLTLHNKSNQLWNLRPVIDGEYWGGADSVMVDAQQSKSYEIFYRPLTMTQEGKKHNGTVFFALPDGSGLLYNLSGNADPPKPIGNIQREVPCKMNYTELLTVTNWLRKPQRFRILIEILKPEKPDPTTTFKGLDYIDVTGLAKKDYKIHFYAHREGTFSSKVTFKNELTGEFLFYYVTIKVGNPGTISTIELSTPVRQSISHVVTISNPLSTMVNFQTNCNVQDVNLPPTLSIPPSSEGCCTFEYLPLKAGNTTGKLTLQSTDLGMYIYDLNLAATVAAPERAVHFVATLGTSQSQLCKFITYARTRVEYASKVDSQEFIVERSVTAASAASGGSEVNVEVTFEPSRLGESRTTLYVSSTIGGEYVFPIYGHCLPPKPQGPHTIKSGGSVQIPFKNIFSQTTAFSFHIDNPVFTVKPSETIRAKKTHNIVVSFEGNQGDSKAVRMGRLLVTCTRSAGCPNSLVWTFYLKGVTGV